MRRLNGRFLPPKSLRGGGQSHIDGMQARQAHADGADADVQHSAIGAAFHETAFALGQLADLAAAVFCIMCRSPGCGKGDGAMCGQMTTILICPVKPLNFLPCKVEMFITGREG